MPQELRRRGRPPRMEIDEIRARAIDVIAREGYGCLTMGTIAEEVGISLRTLHRHFPAKADLVWAPLEPTFAHLRRALENAPADLSVLGAIGAATERSMEEQGQTEAMLRTRLILIATNPDLQEYRSDAFRRWCDELVSFAAQRTGQAPDDLLPLALGRAAQGTIMAALTWWANQEEEVETAPASAIRKALKELEQHVQGTHPTTHR